MFLCNEYANKKQERYCAFKEIQENPIILDFDKCGGWRGIHSMLKDKFGLPDYYGQNWDALWDCLACLFDEPITVELHNFYAQPEQLQDYCQPMLRIFEDIQRETPQFSYKIVS